VCLWDLRSPVCRQDRFGVSSLDPVATITGAHTHTKTPRATILHAGPSFVAHGALCAITTPSTSRVGAKRKAATAAASAAAATLVTPPLQRTSSGSRSYVPGAPAASRRPSSASTPLQLTSPLSPSTTDMALEHDDPAVLDDELLPLASSTLTIPSSPLSTSAPTASQIPVAFPTLSSTPSFLTAPAAPIPVMNTPAPATYFTAPDQRVPSAAAATATTAAVAATGGRPTAGRRAARYSFLCSVVA
jgi:hypothetical protein